jgi:hypothetical protein
VGVLCAGMSAALDADFTLDGLVFLHQSAPYVMASNPFVLRWKDHSCSRWAIDTDADGNIPDDQQVVRTCCMHMIGIPCVSLAQPFLLLCMHEVATQST